MDVPRRREADSRARETQPLVAAAMELLRATRYPALMAIECQCSDGAIVLLGKVPSYYHKQLAQSALMADPAIDSVRNLLEVTTGDEDR